MKTGFSTHLRNKPLKRHERSDHERAKLKVDWQPEASSLTKSEWRQIVVDLIG